MKTSVVATLILFILLIISLTSYSSPYWGALGPGHANFVNMIKVSNKGVLYVATDLGGVYKSNDKGASYNAINTGITNYHIKDIAIDPENNDILYIGTRGGLFKTVDGGNNWVAKRNGIGGPRGSAFTAPISSILIDPEDTQIIYATVGLLRRNITSPLWVNTTNKGSIFKSTDGGENWQKINTKTNNIPDDALIYRLEMGGNASILYVATQYGIYKSTDGGESWLPKNIGLPYTLPYTKYIKRDALSSNTLYLTILNGSVYRSIDGGENWQAYNNGLPDSSINFYRLETDSIGQLYVTGSLHSPGASKGIWKKVNATSSWVKVAGAGANYEIIHGWRKDLSNPQSIAVDPSDLSNNIVYISGSTTLYKTENANESIPVWNQIYTLVNGNEYSNRGINAMGACNTVAIDPKNNKRLYLDSGDHGLLRSENGGQTWLVANNGMRYSQHVYDILVDPIVDVVYASDSKRAAPDNQGGVAKSTDHGDNWIQINAGLPDKTVYSLAMDSTSETNNRVLYAGLQKGGVYRSLDGGLVWADWSAGLPADATVYSLLESPAELSLIYAAVRKGSGFIGGLYKRGKNDNSWLIVNTDFVLSDVYDVAINPLDPQIIYVATRRNSGAGSAGVWKNDKNGADIWTKIIGDPEWVSSLVIDPLNFNSIIATTTSDNYYDESGGNGLIRGSSDGLQLENIEKDISVRTFQDIVFDPVSPERSYTCALGSSLYTHSDLAGHWTLNEGTGTATISDSSGRDNDGTLSGNPAWVTGKVGASALYFDGIDDYGSINNVPLYVDTGYTISAWVKPDGAHDDWAPIVYNNNAGIRFRLKTNNIQFVLRDANDEFRNVVSATSLPDNQWSLVTAVYDSVNNEMRLYINGKLDLAPVIAVGLLASTYDGSVTFPNIGGDIARNRMFSGAIDDIRIYNMAQDNEGVERIYKRGTLVGHWSFNESAGAIAYDNTKISGDAAFSGSPTRVTGNKSSHAIQFDGVDDYGSISNVPLYDDAGYTISAWVKPMGAHDNLAPIVYHYGAGIRFNNSTNKIQFVLRDTNNSFKDIVSTSSLPDNQWSLVTATYDSTSDKMSIYINGILDKEPVIAGGLYSGIYDGSVTFPNIGGNNTNTRMFSGVIDDIRIYNYRLADSEIIGLME